MLLTGLVTECVPAGMSTPRAEEIAIEISKKGPIALRMAKKAIDQGMQLSLQESLQIEKNCYSNVVVTKDRVEEKRTPIYRGE